jgi:hypothetical protein
MSSGKTVDSSATFKNSSDDTSKDGAVVQRVIREVSAGSGYPVLTKTNYSDWALLMKVKMRARMVWDVIEHGGADIHEEMIALDALCSTVPLEMVSSIADKLTTKEACKTIADLRASEIA